MPLSSIPDNCDFLMPACIRSRPFLLPFVKFFQLTFLDFALKHNILCFNYVANNYILLSVKFYDILYA